MKYNMKKIMKRAWEIKRKIKNVFAQALKMAWKIAKYEIAFKKQECQEDGEMTFTIWSAYGKVRAYYKCDWRSKYSNSKSYNYVDLLED